MTWGPQSWIRPLNSLLQFCTENSTCGIGVAWIWKHLKKKCGRRPTSKADNPQHSPLGSSGAIWINNMPYMPPWPLTMCRFSWQRATALREWPDLHHTSCTLGSLLFYLQVKNIENYMIKENGSKNGLGKGSLPVCQMFYDPLASNQ